MVALSTRTRGDLLILLAAFIWGVAFYFQKIAMLEMGPLLFLGTRGAVAAVALLPFVVVEQRRVRGTRLAVVNADVRSDSAFFQRSIVPFGVLGGGVFFLAGATQQTGLVTWLSVGLAFLGIWGLSGGSITSLNSGDILVACSSVFWACLIIVSGQSSHHAQPLSYTCIQFLVVALLGLLSAGVFETIDYQGMVAAAIPILYVGVLSSAFTFGLMAIALQTVPAPRASIILSMETVFAAMAGYLWLGERLGVVPWMGAGLILLAVLMVQRSQDG